MSIESSCNVGATALTLKQVEGLALWEVKVAGLLPVKFTSFDKAQEYYVKQIAFILKHLA